MFRRRAAASSGLKDTSTSGLTEDEVHGADRAVEKCQVAHLLRRHGEDRADQKLLDVLRSLRRAVERQHAERGGHRVNDADDRLLLQRFLVRPHERKEHRSADRKGERVPVAGLALHRMAGEDRRGQAEGRDLREREIDEDHAASEDMQAEIGVDAGEDDAGNERPQQQLDHALSARLQGFRQPLHVLLEQADVVGARGE